MVRRWWFSVIWLLVAFCCEAAVDYDIVYVRQPRAGDFENTTWPEIFHPGRLDAGADLMLLHPDGSEEILVNCTDCSVTDPYVSFDAQWVYYTLFHDQRPEALNGQRGDLPFAGADIYRIHLQSRNIEQLTFGEFTPNTGTGNWNPSDPVNPGSGFNRLGYGILNLGPMPLPGNRLAFTSNRNGQIPTKSFTNPTLQLFVMDIDGENVEAIAPMTIGSALHPTILKDGRLIFSSYESQGLRDRRIWGVWSILPDGRGWAPVVSSMTAPESFHFMTQISNGDIVVDAYYNLNNNGFGALYGMPASVPDDTPAFGSPFPSANPPIDHTPNDVPRTFSMSFTPHGYYAITPMTHHEDHAAPIGTSGERVGKFTHPSAAPNNDLLVVWTPGPANDLNRPTQVPYYDGGLYVINNTTPVWAPDELELIKNDPTYNEAWPRAVVPYGAIHGVAEPASLAWLPNDGSEHGELPEGTAFGLAGTSSVYKRESFPGDGETSFDGLDPFNTSENNASSNWAHQGADAGKYSNSDIWAIRVLAMEGATDRRYGPETPVLGSGNDFVSHANERLRILGEIPLRKFETGGAPIMDTEGNPDTSFLVKLPADTPFTFQTLDRNGMVLNMAQTWHQVRPGEMRADCGGCHSHSQLPLDFSQTAAAQPEYVVRDLSVETPILSQDGGGNPTLIELADPVVDVEFLRDIRPILQRSCIQCHNATDNAGELVLDDLALYDGVPGDYKRLADDADADWGYPPLITNGVWRQTNASRYVRKFQSRRSLLMWKLFGERLDGWDNADHPSASTPGDPNTLPNGANPNSSDLDFTGTIMPPVGGGAPALTIDEKMLFARWIDLGAPIDLSDLRGNPGRGWFMDELRPTVHISMPRPNYNNVPPTRIAFSIADANSGIAAGTLSITADFTVNGVAPGGELLSLATPLSDGRYEIVLNGPLPGTLRDAHVVVSVADEQGNVHVVDRRFHTLPDEGIFRDGFEQAF